MLEEKKEDLLRKILFLINDESEAIKGYSDVIDSISDEDVIKKLKEIREDEEEHLKELNDVLFKI